MSAWRRFRRLFGPEPRADVEHELSFHVEMRARELEAQGLTPEEARRAALRRFGNYAGSRDACVAIDERRTRRMRLAQGWSALTQDTGYAIRAMRRAPVFTIVAAVTLALGIGANSAIFSVVHGVLLRPLPFPQVDRLHRVHTLYPDGTPYSLSAPDFASVRQDARALDRVEAYAIGPFTLLGAGEPMEVRGAQVSDGLFDLLGLTLHAGQGFRRDQHEPGRGHVAVLDHGFWTRQFGGETSVIGRAVTIGGQPFVIAGVLARGARLTTPVDVYAPLEYGPTFDPATQTGRRSEFLSVLARARPGAGDEAVAADLRRIGTDLQTRFPPTNSRLTFSAIGLTETVVGDVRTPLVMLLGAVGFVLLVACANVANLLLARASGRQQELAVRAALGASRGRLVRQLLTESVVLALAGGLIGLGMAYLGTQALVAAQPADIPRVDQIGLDRIVVLFTMGVAALTGLVFGVYPALHASGHTVTEALREGTRSGGASRAGHRARAALVVAEMALAVVLLMGAGLLMRSFAELTSVDRGFETDRGLMFGVLLQGPSYQRGEQVRARAAAFEARLRAIPGVTAVAFGTVVPLGARGSMLDFAVDGAPPPPPSVNAEIAVGSVSPEYFTVIGSPLRRGRVLSDRDAAEAPLVAVINDAAARLWFDGDPVGRVVTVGGQRREIVGVVGDVRQRGLRQPAAPQLFTPYAQRTSRAPRFLLRTAGDPLAQTAAIRTAIREIDPDVAIQSFVPFTQLVDESVARPRFYATLLTLFALVALLLAGTGIFGVMNYAVAQRRHEISVRMALGARAGSVLRLIVGRALILAVVGVAIGLAGTLGLGRAIEGQLFGVTLLDSITLTGVSLVLIAIAATASFLPARRAARVDPVAALRQP